MTKQKATAEDDGQKGKDQPDQSKSVKRGKFFEESKASFTRASSS